MTETSSLVVEKVSFCARGWLLDGNLSYPEEGTVRGTLVIAGPHPHLGGDMENNVVKTLAEVAACHGMATLRFDYRGVGKSEGPPMDVGGRFAEFLATSHVSDEDDLWHDLHAGSMFLEREFPSRLRAIAGYSFGCSLLPAALGYARGDRLRGVPLVLVAPTVSRHNFDAFCRVAEPLAVLASEDDFATSVQDLDMWFSRLKMPREMHRRPCDNHFFRGHEEWVARTAVSFIQRHWD